MADFFTKPLPSKTFFFMRDRIMNVPASWKPERPLARVTHGYTDTFEILHTLGI